MDHSETAIWGNREGSSLFLHPPPAKGIKKFRYTHSVFGRRRKHAHIFKHPPPTQADLGHQKRVKRYAKNTYDNATYTRWRTGFISQTNPQIRIRQKTDAFISAKRDEASRACS